MQTTEESFTGTSSVVVRYKDRIQISFQGQTEKDADFLGGTLAGKQNSLLRLREGHDMCHILNNIQWRLSTSLDPKNFYANARLLENTKSPKTAQFIVRRT